MIHQAGLMVLLALTHTFCLAAMTERKYSIRKTLIIYALFTLFFIGWTLVVSVWLGTNSPYTAPAMFSVTIVAHFFVFILTSSDAFCKKLFLFIGYANLFCIFFCMAALIGDALFPGLSYTGTLYVRNITRTVLYIPAVLVYLKFFRPLIRTVPVKGRRTWYAISLNSALFLAVFTAFVIRLYPHSGHTNENIFLFTVVVLIYCSVLWVIFRTIRYMSDESKMELISKNAEYLQGQLTLAKENELAARTIRHDFRHHNQNLAALLQKGDITEALRYIEQYDGSLDAAKPQKFCPHTTVNAILSSFYLRAQKDGILVSVSADTQEESPIADMDFVAILSNLLENALNGCKECGSQGDIRVDIRTVGDKVVIVCGNPCRHSLGIDRGMLHDRGIGIDSVVLAVRKYDGDIRYELEDGRLTVCVILNV